MVHMYGPISCSGAGCPAPFIFLFTSKTLYKVFPPFFTCRKKYFIEAKKIYHINQEHHTKLFPRVCFCVDYLQLIIKINSKKN